MNLDIKKKAVATKMAKPPSKKNEYVKTKNVGGYPKYVKVNRFK